MKKILSTCLSVLCASIAFAQQPKLVEVETNLKMHITFLADDKLEGRLVGSKGEKAAAKYIANQLKKIGVTPKGVSGYLQPFSVKKNMANPHGHDSDAQAITIVGNNVVGFIDNNAPYTVIIGAHYDPLVITNLVAVLIAQKMLTKNLKFITVLMIMQAALLL